MCVLPGSPHPLTVYPEPESDEILSEKAGPADELRAAPKLRRLSLWRWRIPRWSTGALVFRWPLAAVPSILSRLELPRARLMFPVGPRPLPREWCKRSRSLILQRSNLR